MAEIALVTGASRGIGKSIAVHLARAGFDVAIAARTLHEGESRETSTTVHESDTRPLPGSLTTTAGLIEAEGRRALIIQMDLLDRVSVGRAFATVTERWGPIDVLVNNARFVGPGSMDLLMDTSVELLDDHLEANVMGPIILCKLVLPSMIERRRGTIVNVTSQAALRVPASPAGNNTGWGLGYGFSKAALHKVAEFIALELGDKGILAFNADPKGGILIERNLRNLADKGYDPGTRAPTEVGGASVAWLVRSPDARALNGQTVSMPDLAREHRLVPGWPS